MDDPLLVTAPGQSSRALLYHRLADPRGVYTIRLSESDDVGAMWKTPNIVLRCRGDLRAMETLDARWFGEQIVLAQVEHFRGGRPMKVALYVSRDGRSFTACRKKYLNDYLKLPLRYAFGPIVTFIPGPNGRIDKIALGGYSDAAGHYTQWVYRLKAAKGEVMTGQLSISKREVIMKNDEEQLHFPFLHEAADGTWYMTYREGPHGVPGGDRVECRRSADRGATWQPWPGLAAEPLLRLFRAQLRDSTLISHRYQLDAGEGSERRAYILLSKDDGRTWKRQPAPIGGLPFDPKRFLGLWGRFVELTEYRLLCTLYGYKPNEKKYSLGVVESFDGGLHWRYLTTMCDDGTLGREGPDEAGLVLLKSGKLLSVFRTGNNMFQVTSSDGGRTWSAPTDLGAFGVSPQLLLLENGVLILAYGTRNVCVRASWDGTREKWSEPLMVYKCPGSGYTDLQPLSSDRFQMVYDESPLFEKVKGGWGRIARVEVTASPGRGK